ncbi:phosphotransferase enzyme family protein [Pedobacter sp. MC2016-24]|uniref:phosphotransferase enzyme family protein n=1 Tax=Pedobacter sp. MC2016-24 TaxID=2780090 RepID=UPI001882D18A|nr:aminoglycoside phosphotransferase family protein [Pedobacter sp. MC2016-24]MBE9597917.1 aminoglycoside phosphotransferase family protein [Pedobacter sp. MC2016-24]
MFDHILALYGINQQSSSIQPFGDGLINHTWKIATAGANFILQKVNSDVFKTPEEIDENLLLLKQFLSKYHPDYLFVAPVRSSSGLSLIHDASGYFRLFPFIEGSAAVNVVTKKEEAYEAAKQFGKFSRLLADFEASKLNITIPDFHNLALRYTQFEYACAQAEPERLQAARESIDFITAHRDIVETYKQLVKDPNIHLRVIHHDTKISNILFDANQEGLCVIDLDTVMPGYFISDVGDMMRTYLSAASEEETDLSKVSVRKDFFDAIRQGYMEEMDSVLSEAEKEYFNYSGEFIIYMQAIRFLTDFLQKDIYYGAKYPDHNINRAKNQIALLKGYLAIKTEVNNEQL